MLYQKGFRDSLGRLLAASTTTIGATDLFGVVPVHGLEGLSSKRVVVLPDVFVDMFVPITSASMFLEGAQERWQRGGGSLPVEASHVRVGGNAGNLAWALARLGAQVDVVGVAAAEGRSLLAEATEGLPVHLDHLTVESPGPRTLALEAPEGNLMLSHPGGVASYGPEDVPEAAWQKIAEADAVAVLNWSQDLHGTALLEQVASAAGAGTFVYLDTGDPHARAGGLAGAAGKARMLEACEELLASPAWAEVDAWGMNDVEACCFGGDDGDPAAAARRLARMLGVRVDLHGTTGATSIIDGHETTIACAPRKALRRTGAGDAWNAGNVAGSLLGLPAEERLALAHATAGHVVSSPDGAPPSGALLDRAFA